MISSVYLQELHDFYAGGSDSSLSYPDVDLTVLIALTVPLGTLREF